MISLSSRSAKWIRHGHLGLLLCAALLTAATIAAPEATHVAAASSSPSTSQGPLFGVYPLYVGKTTLPGGHFNYSVDPGGSVSDGVVLENFSDHPLDFVVYGADLLAASGGGLAPAQASETMHEAGAWITVSMPNVTVPAHGEFADHFTLTVPAAVSPGEHLGAVVASANVGKTPQGTIVEARTALIAVVTVSGSAHPSASLSPLRGSTSAPEAVGFDITLTNTGNLLLTYAGSVAVYDGAGHKVASLPLNPSDAYVVPAGHVPLAAIWRETSPPTGRYTAQATVTILASGKPVGTLTSQTLQLPIGSRASILIVVGLGLGLIVLLAAWFFVRRMLRRNRRHTRGSGRAARPSDSATSAWHPS